MLVRGDAVATPEVQRSQVSRQEPSLAVASDASTEAVPVFLQPCLSSPYIQASSFVSNINVMNASFFDAKICSSGSIQCLSFGKSAAEILTSYARAR